MYRAAEKIRDGAAAVTDGDEASQENKLDAVKRHIKVLVNDSDVTADARFTGNTHKEVISTVDSSIMELDYLEYEITTSKGKVTQKKTIDIKFITQETAQVFKEANEAIKALKVPDSIADITEEFKAQVEGAKDLSDKASKLGAILGEDRNSKIDIDTSNLRNVLLSIANTKVERAELAADTIGLSYDTKVEAYMEADIAVAALLDANIRDSFGDRLAIVKAKNEGLVILTSIEITNRANYLEYAVGDTLDLTGLVVTGKYSDGSTKEETVTLRNCSGADTSTVGTKTVTITIDYKTTTFEIEVKPA